MQKSFLKLLTAALVATSLLMSVPSAFAQGLTTSALNGTVTNKDGQPLGGATVTVVHEPSGTRAVTTSRSNGQYDFAGLRVGGPYSVTISTQGYTPENFNDVYLDVGQVGVVNATLSSEVIQLEKLSVTASRDGIFDSGKIGTGTTMSDRQIDTVSTVRRNIQDIAVLDSRLALMSLDQGGQLSAQGQNFRFNSFTVDGVQAIDQFGLNSNGFPSLRSPIPIEAIQSFSVDLTPYDVRRAGATGAYINAVIKSGTNDLHGVIYFEKTSQRMRGPNPITGAHEPFVERNYGFAVGGPIIKNKLFFFIDYDDFQRKTVAPQANFIPTSTDVAAVIAQATTLGYDAGGLTAGDNLSIQKTKIAKLDWNISDKHRATFTYRQNRGSSVIFANYTGSTTTSLSNYWWTSPLNSDNYTAQLFSQWTPDFRTEATVAYTKINSEPNSIGKAFPQVQVQNVGGIRLDTGASVTNGSIFLGTESSRQLNHLFTNERLGRFSGDYSFGDHTITAGLEDISTKYDNAFVQFADGFYIFPTIAAWQAGTPVTGYTLQKANPGFTVADAVAKFSYDAYAVFIQDTWKPNSQLTLLAGLRYDYPYLPTAPPVAAGFSTAGFTRDDGVTPVIQNNTTNSGNATLAPRLGFIYNLKTDRKTQVRGGLGLFQGKNPAVWISNAYGSAGATGAVGVFNTLGIPGFNFVPDPNSQVPPAGSPPAPTINITDKKFRQPALWKGNLAIDHQLPFGGLTFTAEFSALKVYEAVQYEYLNYQVATSGPTTMPDGRIRYASALTSGTTGNTQGKRRNTAFADVYYLTNTNKGAGNFETLQLSRPMKNHWSWSASYTRSHSTEVAPATSSIASSNYTARAVFNPNENVASTSNTNIKDRVVIQVTREFEFIKKYMTTLSVVYQGRTGHNYSWVFFGDANGDGNTGVDLLYVPTGPTDPKVTWADTTQRDNFFAFAQSTGLMKYAGQAVPRNSETSPWQQTIDLRFVQQIPLYRNVRAELYANLLNFWNLVDKNWGIQEEVPFSYKRRVASASYNAAGNGGLGSWGYTFTSADTVPITVNDTPISRWQAQIGIRLRF